MQAKVSSNNPERIRSLCLVVGVYAHGKLTPAAHKLDNISDGRIRKLIKNGDFSGKSGATLLLPDFPGVAAKRVLLTGLGNAKTCDRHALKKAVAAATKTVHELGWKEAAYLLCDTEIEGQNVASKCKTIVTAADAAIYRFDKLKKGKNKPGLSKLQLLVDDAGDVKEASAGARQGQATAAGVKLARELGNLPGNVCTPNFLAKQARRLKTSHNLKVKVLSEADMAKLGMGSLLSVSRGSRQPAKLIVMEYSGGRKNSAPVALVGKGLTFDAGGISIKPSAKMDEMKYDMCGAASVFGTLVAVAEMKLPLNVVGIVPSSENLPDGDANKPGDIVTSMSGQTIEILNTDAEGRLILCDALTYCQRFKPRTVIDIATLTGACVVALGAPASGLFSNDQSLADALLDAGERSGDRAWQMPLWDEYQPQLHSNFADIANIGGPGAGAVTAACFLSRFTKSLTWAHLDIAGTAWKSSPKGATGRPVPLLTQYLIDQCDKN